MDELTKSPKPESKLPKTPQEGKTQNFTQFAKEK